MHETKQRVQCDAFLIQCTTGSMPDNSIGSSSATSSSRGMDLPKEWKRAKLEVDDMMTWDFMGRQRKERKPMGITLLKPLTKTKLSLDRIDEIEDWPLPTTEPGVKIEVKGKQRIQGL